MTTSQIAEVLEGSIQGFQEQALTQPMNPKKLVNTIKYLYSLTYLDANRLKLILKQGAKSNGLMRIDDAVFEELVDVLDLPLEITNDNKA